MKSILIIVIAVALFPVLLPFFPVLFPDVWSKAKNGGF